MVCIRQRVWIASFYIGENGQGKENTMWNCPSIDPILVISKMLVLGFYLFDLILYVPSAIFQLNRDGSSWVEPLLS